MPSNFGLKLQNSPKLPHIHAIFYCILMQMSNHVNREKSCEKSFQKKKPQPIPALKWRYLFCAFSPFLSTLLGVTFLPNCTSVFFFQWPRADAKSARLARFLIKTTLYGIWKFRNKATFHNSHEDSQAIIRYIKTDIRKRISLDHFRLSQSDFVSAWESILCNVADSSFHVLL